MSKRIKDSYSGVLCQNLSKMQEDGSLTDVTLECDDGVTIPCHRVVLAAQSPVFKAMFSDGFQEGATNTVKIRGFRSTSIRLMVALMYCNVDEFCDSMSQATDVTLDLFSAAHLYDYSHLVKVCKRLLIESMDTDNAADLYLKGFLTDVAGLKTAAMKFISENFAEVEKTDQWKELAKNYPQAVHEMLAFVCKKKK